MMLQVIDQDLTVCKLPQGSPVDLSHLTGGGSEPAVYRTVALFAQMRIA